MLEPLDDYFPRFDENTGAVRVPVIVSYVFITKGEQKIKNLIAPFDLPQLENIIFSIMGIPDRPLVGFQAMDNFCYSLAFLTHL